MNVDPQKEIEWLERENERLSTQIAALRMSCQDLHEIACNAFKKGKITPVGETHVIMHVTVPKILRNTKPEGTA